MSRVRPNGQQFAQALISAQPSVELKGRADDLDWLVGGWKAVVRDYDDDGTVHTSDGEWWFSWVLEGRALQDVWIVPSRAQSGNRKRLRYGTTLRWFDDAHDVWKILWFNPVTGATNTLSGGRQGANLVFEGIADAAKIRWSFNDITPNSFVWKGESFDGARIKLGSEFILRRI